MGSPALPDVLWLRSGTTLAQEQGGAARVDEPLGPKGAAAAERAGSAVREAYRVKHAWCSPLSRSLATAVRAFPVSSGVTIHVDPDLRDFSLQQREAAPLHISHR